MSLTFDSNDGDSLQYFPLLTHRQEETLEQLKAGEIESVRVSASTHLKQERGIDVVIPLKKNMYVTTDSIKLANERNLWEPHPTREGQQIAEIGEKPGDLVWKECPVLTRGVLCRWFKKDGTPTEVLFVTTHPNSNGKKILGSYDQKKRD